MDKQEKFWDDIYKSEVNIKVLNNKYRITDSQLREDRITFIKINDVVVKGCGAKTLSVDYKTDVREGYDGPFTVLTQFPSKKEAQNCYEGDYQNIIPLRKGAIDMNFRIVEKKIQFSNQ